MQTTPLVSICAIVRDEAHQIGGLLDSLGDLPVDWRFVDTGSVDGTPELLRARGCDVIERPWRDDFAWARNEGLPRATGRWVLVLDADDRLHGGHALWALLATDPAVDVLHLLVESASPAGTERLLQPRVFRREAQVRYREPVHAVPVIDGLREAVGPGRIEHIGYRAAGALLQRAERARRILVTLPADAPHRLAQQVRTEASVGAWPEVVAAAERFAAVVGPPPADVAAMWALALASLGRPTEAALVVAEALRRHPRAIDLYYAGFVAHGLGHLGLARDAALGRPFPGIASSFDRAPDLARALVQIGVLDPSVLDTELAQAPFTQERYGASAAREHPERPEHPSSTHPPTSAGALQTPNP